MRKFLLLFLFTFLEFLSKFKAKFDNISRLSRPTINNPTCFEQTISSTKNKKISFRNEANLSEKTLSINKTKEISKLSLKNSNSHLIKIKTPQQNVLANKINNKNKRKKKLDKSSKKETKIEKNKKFKKKNRIKKQQKWSRILHSKKSNITSTQNSNTTKQIFTKSQIPFKNSDITLKKSKLNQKKSSIINPKILQKIKFKNTRSKSFKKKHSTLYPKEIKITTKTTDESISEKISKTQFALKSSLALLLLLIIFVLTVSVGFIIKKVYLPEIKCAIMNGYSQFIEKQLPYRRLSGLKLQLFLNFTWVNEATYPQASFIPESALPHINLKVTVQEYPEGLKYFIEYKESTPRNLHPDHFVINPLLTAEKVFYFEVEIFYLHDLTQILIGFAEDTFLQENKEQFLGEFEGSIGLNIRTGEVKAAGEVIHTFDLASIVSEFHGINESGMLETTGNFYGIGINFHTHLFFFTFNGIMLNGLSFQAQTSLRYKINDMRKRDLINNEEGIRTSKKLNALGRKVQLEKKYKDQMKNLKQFPCKLKNVVPVFGISGLSKIEVNIGAFPFQLKDRELKHGLLFDTVNS